MAKKEGWELGWPTATSTTGQQEWFVFCRRMLWFYCHDFCPQETFISRLYLATFPSFLISLWIFSFLILLFSCHLVWNGSCLCDYRVHWAHIKDPSSPFLCHEKQKLKQGYSNNGIIEWYFLEVPLQLQWPGHFLRQGWNFCLMTLSGCFYLLGLDLIIQVHINSWNLSHPMAKTSII